MDSQLHSKRSYGSFFPKNNTLKKAHQNSNYYQKSFNSHSKANYKKNLQQYSYNNDNYNQHRPIDAPSWDIFNGKASNNKGNYGKFGGQQNHSNYAKNFNNRGYSVSDKTTGSTGASDNDGNTIFSELSGFKIIQNGKTVYDETSQEFDFSDSDSDESQKAKFASSVMTIGPNAKEISIPMFAETD